MNLEAAATAIQAKGYRATVRHNLRGPAGKAGGIYVFGPYVNTYVYANINGEIAEADVDGLKDATTYTTPATARHAG